MYHLLGSPLYLNKQKTGHSWGREPLQQHRHQIKRYQLNRSTQYIFVLTKMCFIRVVSSNIPIFCQGKEKKNLKCVASICITENESGRKKRVWSDESNKSQSWFLWSEPLCFQLNLTTRPPQTQEHTHTACSGGPGRSENKELLLSKSAAIKPHHHHHQQHLLLLHLHHPSC